MSADDVVEAAGGVLWRRGDKRPEVAVIHRPKYDDWTLPKGKLEPDEHPVLGALREIAEETGSVAVPGRPLGEVSYSKDGRPKRVRYWSMRAVGGGFRTNDEVDRLVWLSTKKATKLLDFDHDRQVLANFEEAPVDTWPLLLVRHASAGSRERWSGPDEERPLDQRGQQQASALADVFEPYGVRELYSADIVRCIDTLAPLAMRLKQPVQTEPLVSDAGYDEHPEAAVRWLADVVSRRTPVAVSSQGGPVPELAEQLCRELEHDCGPLPRTRKGGYVVVHLHDRKRGQVADVESWEPPV